MNRLTDDKVYEVKKRIIDTLEAEGYKPNLICERWYIKLAEYERTGLMPDEITEAISTRQGEWISVNDRLPENASDVLVYTNAIYIGWYDAHFNHWTVYGFGKAKNVTHWMPLPEPPKEV